MHDAIGVFGYPKSGNTWIQSIFASLGQKVDPAYFQDDIHVSAVNSTKLKPHPLVTLNGGKPCIVYKSHEYYKGNDLLHHNPAFGVRKLEKAILVKRNPLDMLLSYLNYICFVVNKCQQNSQNIPDDLLLYCTRRLGVSERFVLEEFSKLSSLGAMREKGMLDSALVFFSKFDLIIDPLENIASSWSNQILSWERQSDIELLSIRYEDLLDFEERELERISVFIDIDLTLLVSACRQQKKGALLERKDNIKSKKPAFYNKMTHGHYINYFDVKLLSDFFNRHSQVIRACGYEDILS